MPSHFAWVDFKEEDRRRMAHILDLFLEQDTRDELGIGTVRDAIADLLFPGTSTIQTRARYFLFLPWIYQNYEKKKIAGSDIAKKARQDEVKLIDTLIANGESDGVIGIEKRSELQRLPSSIYWAGLGTWHIRCFPGSREQYHKTWDSLLRRRDATLFDDDKNIVIASNSVTWDPELPTPPADFLNTAVLALTKPEAEYLQQRILGLGQTLLGHLVSQTQSTEQVRFIWDHSQSKSFPDKYKVQVEHARLFSLAMNGASLIYNLMLAELRQNPEWINLYQTSYESWSSELQSQVLSFNAWKRGDFWGVIESTGAKLSPRTRSFVDTWLDFIVNTKNHRTLAVNNSVRSLISERERILKHSKARITNSRALERWTGSAGVQRLDYRWHRVHTLVKDIIKGLGD